MIDRRYIGHRFAPFATIVESGRVRLYCKATGDDAEFHCEAAVARAAGYRGIPTPLTFPAAIAMDNPNPRAVIELLGIDIAWVLHGEEQYEYWAPICVGDQITTELRIAEIYEKKGGALEFVVTELNMHNQLDELVCSCRRSLVVRRPQAGTASKGDAT